MEGHCIRSYLWHTQQDSFESLSLHVSMFSLYMLVSVMILWIFICYHGSNSVCILISSAPFHDVEEYSLDPPMSQGPISLWSNLEGKWRLSTRLVFRQVKLWQWVNKQSYLMQECQQAATSQHRPSHCHWLLRCDTMQPCRNMDFVDQYGVLAWFLFLVLCTAISYMSAIFSLQL